MGYLKEHVMREGGLVAAFSCDVCGDRIRIPGKCRYCDDQAERDAKLEEQIEERREARRG